ncbi:baculoviral iap repeat-containing protein 7-like [Plakobranchus ocellatus]|uniref:Baculoviral iap repeat-containing protein 7-like n=1 Tax=Plakobranchus ocellatus TaxID=259542 RepID=A0AAV3ZMV9_9GAST|nr:baculoviral iap repeat-containing protein 7-like [Plakobranchus ocellatus]
MQRNVPPGMEPVDVISGYHDNENGEMEVEYEQVFVQRPVGGVFHEPLDQGPEHLLNGSNSSIQMRPRNTANSIRELYDEKIRLATFEGCWSKDYPVVVKDLARAGFYYVGPGDRVKCAFCQKTLQSWERGDVAEQEHRLIYPNCPFVLGRCNEINIPINSPEALQQSHG